MKGTLMFDNLNDLSFFDADEELAQHIQNLAIKDGLLEDLSFRNSKGVVDKNIVMQLFSPLIASYKVMQAQFGNRYKSIESEDGVLLVFNEVLNYIVIGVSSAEETLEDIEQEISFFLVLVKLLYGPSLHMIKKEISTSCDDCSRSELLSQIINTWRFLKLEQQMFLIEAIERLVVNQDIKSMCGNILQDALEKIRSSHRVGAYSHAFILVDTKLLALYSSRNSAQLPKDQLLLLILVVQVLRSSFAQFDEVAQEVVARDTEDEQFFVPIAKLHAEKQSEEKHDKTALHKSNKKEETAEKTAELKDEIRSLLIYLKTSECSLTPHMVFAIKLTYKITLVVLCELPAEGVASSCLYELIESLYNLQQHPSARQTVPSSDSLELTFRGLIDSIWKLKFDEKAACMKKLISKWEQMKLCGFTSFLDDPNHGTVNPRLDSSISCLCESLSNVFEEAIAEPMLKHEKQMQSPEEQEKFFILQKNCGRKLKDTTDYLEVKAVQNITMSPYVTEYPGLIHFIYIDRNNDCVIAPSVVLKKGHLNGTTSLKNKIWRMVRFGRSRVDGANNYCCLWKEDDLCFLYHIWFEDSAGRAIKPTRYPSLKYFPPKGILCGNFYKKLVRECFPDASYDHIFCYELFCIHLESTSAEVIVEHSLRLCSALWELTDAYRASLELL